MDLMKYIAVANVDAQQMNTVRMVFTAEWLMLLAELGGVRQLRHCCRSQNQVRWLSVGCDPRCCKNRI